MTQKQSYFIEGLQGAGKSTLVNRLAENYPEKKICREGDYTPVDLAWCAYVDETTYQDILARSPSLSEEMAKYAVPEDEIFECAMIQNILENMMLYLQIPEGEILAFYRKVHEILQNKPYKILYLDVEDIEGSLEVIKKKELMKMVWSPEGEGL